MATDKSPASFIPNYTCDGTDITIPLASIPGLTAALAHPSTGDIRAVLAFLLSHLASEMAASPTVLNQSCIITVTPEVQISGLTRTSFLIRILTVPSGYEYPDPSNYVGPWA
jgi:hypothetical protein